MQGGTDFQTSPYFFLVIALYFMVCPEGIWTQLQISVLQSSDEGREVPGFQSTVGSRTVFRGYQEENRE